MGDLTGQLGPIGGLLFSVASILGPLEAIPLLGLPFIVFDFLLGVAAGLLANIGL